MGFMDSVQSAGQRAKLNGEIVLIDRDLAARKKLFGVELYDAIDLIEKKNKTAILSTPNLFKGIETQISEPLDVCRKEITVMEGEKAAKESEQTHLEVKRERETKPSIGTWVSRSSADAKLTVEIAMLERNIKIRKEKFGLDIWDIIAQPTSVIENISADTKKETGLGKVKGAVGGLTKGVTSTFSAGLGKLSGDERAIQALVEKAKDDITLMERSKARKLEIIEKLSSK